MRWNVIVFGALALLLVSCAPQEEAVGTAADPATATAPAPTGTLPPATTQTAPTGTAGDTATAGDRPVPNTHTVDHGGVMHMPGSENATQRCGACHGQDLRGGKVATTSCYDCHDAVWQQQS